MLSLDFGVGWSDGSFAGKKGIYGYGAKSVRSDGVIICVEADNSSIYNSFSGIRCRLGFDDKDF